MANRGVKCWDPSNSQDWDKMDVSAICTKRMMRDIEAILQEEKSGSLGIFIYPNSENICKLRALIVGPPDTPYDGGFFEFYLRVPPGYPIAAPRVRLLTTGDSTVRFGPNLYATGMVCLSILGTYAGPSWTPVMSVETVLKSIQSVMSTEAIRNEPGYEHFLKSNPEVKEYDKIIRHETIRIAVVDSVKKAVKPGNESGIPEKFRETMLRRFLLNVERVVQECELQMSSDGQSFKSVYGSNIGRYQWGNLKKQVLALESTARQALDLLSVNVNSNKGAAG